MELETCLESESRDFAEECLMEFFDEETVEELLEEYFDDEDE